MGVKFLDKGSSSGGLYIHIPFCRKKCFYCDFYSVGASKADFSIYIKCLMAELSARKTELPHCVDTLYIGGGTPSLIPASDFLFLTRSLVHTIPASWTLTDEQLKFNGEFTIEVNPEDVSEDSCRLWKEAGVNRVSMGIQSFVDRDLQRIGRHHSAKSALQSIEMLKKHFDNVSIDLIFGLPGQTMEDWRYNLRMCVESGVQHLSLYSLMFEEGTPLTVMRDQGRIEEQPEEISVDMFRLASEFLNQYGFRRYEISNYSLPGFESRHNGSYWTGAPYLGIGPGAHSYDGRRIRRMNPGDAKNYIDHYVSACESNFFEEEILSDSELQEEYILTRMRTEAGIDIPDYASRFGNAAAETLAGKAEELGNLVEISDRGLKLSADGVMVSDRVIFELSEF